MSHSLVSPNLLEVPSPLVPFDSLLSRIDDFITTVLDGGHLVEAVIDIVDGDDTPWKAEINATTDADIKPFERRSARESLPHVCAMEVTLRREFPTDLIDRLCCEFPEAEIHLPALIIRNATCRPPELNRRPEIGVYFHGDISS